MACQPNNTLNPEAMACQAFRSAVEALPAVAGLMGGSWSVREVRALACVRLGVFIVVCTLSFDVSKVTPFTVMISVTPTGPTNDFLVALSVYEKDASFLSAVVAVVKWK